MNYTENISQIISNSTIKQEEIFNFEDTPHEKEFLKVYEFYCETLKIDSVYGIEPNYIYFVNDASINAKATKFENSYFIGINSGTIIGLISRLKSSEMPLSNLGMSLDSSKIGTEPNNLVYQLCLHFTFYHELAHLIQQSDSLENVSIQLISESELYNERKHLEELDADNYSSLCLSAHIIQLFENNFGEKGEIKDLVNLFTVCCAASISYILSFYSMKKDFYTFDRLHPHPIIRISCILNHILEYAQQYFGKSKFTNEIRKTVQSEAFNLCEQYYDKGIINRYKTSTKDNISEIINYLEHFRELEENDTSLSVFKRNKLIDLERKKNDI